MLPWVLSIGQLSIVKMRTQLGVVGVGQAEGQCGCPLWMAYMYSLNEVNRVSRRIPERMHFWLWYPHAVARFWHITHAELRRPRHCNVSIVAQGMAPTQASLYLFRGIFIQSCCWHTSSHAWVSEYQAICNREHGGSKEHRSHLPKELCQPLRQGKACNSSKVS